MAVDGPQGIGSKMAHRIRSEMAESGTGRRGIGLAISVLTFLLAFIVSLPTLYERITYVAGWISAVQLPEWVEPALSVVLAAGFASLLIFLGKLGLRFAGRVRTLEQDYIDLLDAFTALQLCGYIERGLLNRWVPRWAEVMTSPMGNPQIDDPALIRSRKHDTTSWSVAEAHVIDEALSGYWRARLAPGSPSEAPADISSENANHGSAHDATAQPNWFGLMDAHPYWRDAVEAGDKAKIFHCEADIKRHMRPWGQALAGHSQGSFSIIASASR